MTAPAKFNRRSIRLDGYDYASAGAYFVTICANENAVGIVTNIDNVCRGEACLALNSTTNTKTTSNTNSNPAHVFGHIDNGKMVLNELGRIVDQRWRALPDHHQTIIPDEFVIMPNHIHLILFLTNDDVRARQASPLQTGTKSISIREGA